MKTYIKQWKFTSFIWSFCCLKPFSRPYIKFFFFSFFLLIGSQALLAQHVLRGKVVDDVFESLPGATIGIKGSEIGAVTDVDGNFLLEIPNPKDTLQIRFLGFQTLEVIAGTERERSFQLHVDEEHFKLNEVTVVGFGVQKKVTVTGSISTVSANDIQQAGTPSLSNALTGRMPGIITRQSTGEPGSDQAQVYIRGFGTWGNRNPLILVDGVERSMDNINAYEIESFSVLKDASATAVYGSRGANGVILINTKRGLTGKPTVTLRSETALNTPLRLPQYINSAQYASLMNEGLRNVGQQERWTEEEVQKFADGSDPYFYPNVNWTDEIMRKQTYQTINNLSVSGGGEVIRYYTNIGYTDQNGIWKSDPNNPYETNVSMKRYNYRANVDVNVSKSLVLEVGIGGIFQQQNYSATGSDALLEALRVTPPLAYSPRNPDGSPAGTPTLIGNNPWGMATQSGYSVHMNNTVQGTFVAKWDLSRVLQGLSANGRFAYDHFFFGGINRHKTFEVKQFLGFDQESGEEQYRQLREEQPLGYYTANNSNRSIYNELILNYNRTFEKHNVTGMVLYNQRDYVHITASTSIGNLPFRRQGISARATYAYDNKYLLEYNMGYNGSENFPKGQRFGFFPSVSAGYVILGKDNNWLNEMKLRGSYGLVGNDQIGANRFLFLTTVNARNAQSYPFGDGQIHRPGIDEMQIGNSNVTWEVAKKTNIGIDLDLDIFKNNLTIQVDAFNEIRDGILIQRRIIPDVSGFNPNSIPFGNIGKAKNKGLDGVMEFRRSTGSGLYYSLRGNFTYARNTVLENDEPVQKYAYQSGKGLPIDQPFGLVALGFFGSQEEIDNSPRQTYQDIVRVGDIKYQDVNGDGTIDDFDRVPIGYPRNPEFMYGFGGTVAYKNFDISLFFAGAERTSLYINGPSIFPFLKGQGSYNILTEYYDNRWTPESANTAKYPATTNDINLNNYRQSTIYMLDASYLRLRNAEIGYTLPFSKMEKLGINSLRMFVNGLNLYTWDKVKVMDPESDNGVGRYPVPQTLNFGLHISFK